MQDLIERRAALTALCEDCLQKYEGICPHPASRCVEFRTIKQIPAIDAEPVRHGQMIEGRYPNENKCSECGLEFRDDIGFIIQDDDGVFHYPKRCPECGCYWVRIIGHGRPISGKRAISLISEMPSASMWIPCKERLPESVGNKVLVFCTGEDVSDYVGFGHYENFKHIETWYNLETGLPFADWGLTVTHWMPRPEPPEKEDADDA